jgi:hypothetical protein
MTGGQDATAPRTYESFKRAAGRTGLSLTMLENHIATGRLTTYRIGRRIRRLASDELDSLIAHALPEPQP